MDKLSFTCLRLLVPNFVVLGTNFIEDNFSTDQWGLYFGVIQMHYIYCALSFYCYCISSTSDHQSLDPRGWGSNSCLNGLSEATLLVRVRDGIWSGSHDSKAGDCLDLHRLSCFASSFTIQFQSPHQGLALDLGALSLPQSSGCL